MSDLGHPAAAFGLGIALGTSPGPVQLLLFSESSRGGVGRGLRAMAGANGTFGAMLLLLALGLSSLEPGPGFLRIVRVIGGSFLVFLAIDALRESRTAEVHETERAGRHPTVRGVIAVIVNPGAYVFLATTATALLADATHEGGRSIALLTALALLAGVSLMDSAMVVLGAGAHRVSERFLRILGDALALGLGALGVWLVIRGIAG
jgi:threonine/homoserine/homoserine lactone efflux protein